METSWSIKKLGGVKVDVTRLDGNDGSDGCGSDE